jgi:hypothetical protein
MTYKRKPKQCLMCAQVYTPSGNCSKFCNTCAEVNRKQTMRNRHQRTYVKKGYSQFRENNNNWKGGIGVYRQIKKAEQCEECGSRENLLIHHIDEDRYNNTLENLKCLCKRCHQVNHKCWLVLPRGAWLSSLKKGMPTHKKRDKKGRFTK